MEPGELIIVVGVVVIFACLLGITIFVLDLIYVIVEPRIRLMPSNDAPRTQLKIKSGSTHWITRLKARAQKENQDYKTQAEGPTRKRRFSWSTAVRKVEKSLRRFGSRSGIFLQELRKYPSATFGLAVILILLAGSIYAAVFLPCEQYGQEKDGFIQTGLYPAPAYGLLFAEPGSSPFNLQNGACHLTVTSLLFEQGSNVQPQLVLLGQVYGWAGTDYARRDLIVPLFWGMPFALLIGLAGSLITALAAMLLPAMGVWYGGWVDNLFQRLTEVNMVLPSLPIAVLTNVLFNWNIWMILGIIVVLNTFGSPIKTLRSAFLQAKEAPYIETARAYGTGNFRIITRYLVPRILPVLIPQLISQVPSFIFLEATLGFFNIKSNFPSWGRIIYEGLTRGALYGSPFRVLEPISLLLLTSLAFALPGSALERILNPRMIDTVPAIGVEGK